MDLLKGLVDEKTLKILDLFLKNPNEFFHINKVAQETKVPLATTFRIMMQLTQIEFIEYKQISKFKIYRLSNSKRSRSLRKLL
jgi:DNA-binding IclR family transcriptional regulator